MHLEHVNRFNQRFRSELQCVCVWICVSDNTTYTFAIMIVYRQTRYFHIPYQIRDNPAKYDTRNQQCRKLAKSVRYNNIALTALCVCLCVFWVCVFDIEKRMRTPHRILDLRVSVGLFIKKRLLASRKQRDRYVQVCISYYYR